MITGLKVNEIANLGNNVKTMIKNESCTVLMMNDVTGEGIMTVYQVMLGVMICFSDMHMEKCDSEFELQKDKKVLCIDHCREGRIEMEVQPGVFSIMQENELRLDNREKIKAVHAQITGDLKTRFTIEDLSSMYDMPATTMKKCFKDVYGDSIYSYQKRYRVNVAASMLMQDADREIQDIAACVGYENPGKFSVAFRSVMGVSPAEYRIRKEG